MNFHPVFFSSRAFTLGYVSMAFFSLSCGRLSSENAESEIAMYGGQKDNGTFTSSVAILRPVANNQWIVTCTATKIAGNILLTAAHCVLPVGALIDGKYFRPTYKVGGIQRIATGQDANTGPKQELKIKSIDFFPGFLDRFQKCKKDCEGIYMGAEELVPDLSIHFPDMVLITYEDEIQNATVAKLGTFNDHEKLAISGYGINLSLPDFENQVKKSGINSTSIKDGDKRFLQFIPSNFSDLIAQLKVSILPSISELDYNPREFPPAELPMTIFVKYRNPVDQKTFVNISKNKESESVLQSMPPNITNGYAMDGDSGGGIFNKVNKTQTVVGVVSGWVKEHWNLPTYYFGIETAITKNPLRNTYQWISDLIKKNEIKTPSKR